MNNFFSHTFFGLIFLIFQGLFLNNINLFEWLNPFLYIYFIVYYPLKNNRIIFILISFLYGLIQDFFSDTHAIHSAACLIIAYFRPVFLKLYFGMAYEHQVVKFNSVELNQNIFYLFTLTFVHHLIIFCLEVFDFGKILLILKNTFFNSLFTFFIVYIFYEFLINKNKFS